jgi:hypothetical protein
MSFHINRKIGKNNRCKVYARSVGGRKQLLLQAGKEFKREGFVLI